MDYNKIGTYIQTKRKEKNLTQKQLADRINVTDKAVSKWERGIGCPDVSLLEKLSEELDVSILDILNGENVDEKEMSKKDLNIYLKSASQISKKNIINKMSIALATIIIFISLLLLISNIQNTIKLKNSMYQPNNLDFINYIEKSKEKIETIKKSKGIFSDEDYQLILEKIDKIYEYFDISKLLCKNENDNCNINDSYIYTYYFSTLNYYKFQKDIYEILGKYDDSIDSDTFTKIAIDAKMSVYSEFEFEENYNNYYENNIIKHPKFYNSQIQEYGIIALEFKAYNIMRTLNYITKVGEIYE